MNDAPTQRAPTLYAIILIKLAKGALLLLLALGVYSLADDNLTEDFRALLRWVHLNPEREFFSSLMARVSHITPENVYWVATGTACYSVFSLVEGVGLVFRVAWAGWMAIGESMFFIPIELYDLLQHFTYKVSVILLINLLICWYLLQNRHRLFKHAFHRPARVINTPDFPDI